MLVIKALKTFLSFSSNASQIRISCSRLSSPENFCPFPPHNGEQTLARYRSCSIHEYQILLWANIATIFTILQCYTIQICLQLRANLQQELNLLLAIAKSWDRFCEQNGELISLYFQCDNDNDKIATEQKSGEILNNDLAGSACF